MLNPSLITSEKPLKAKIKAISGAVAKIALSDGQNLDVNVKYLPKGVTTGDMVYISMVSDKQLNLGRQEIARAVLDEILG
ncbi:MAG: hypothetical protein OEV37_00640 [Candidatus Berkelbacteria bacterium]|nr:hypothetical protein [Candidatus Berkelbacteria bacterium]